MDKVKQTSTVRIRQRKPAVDAPVSPVIPEDVRRLFGPSPRTTLDDASAYEDLLARFAQAVKPADMIEWIWLQDIVNLVWEARRLRQAKADLLRLSFRTAMADVLGQCNAPTLPMLDDPLDLRAEKLAHGWARNDPHFRSAVARRLEEVGLNLAAVEAAAVQMNIDTLERLDRLITAADARRDAVLREIERRRAAMAERLRHAAETVIDVEAQP